MTGYAETALVRSLTFLAESQAAISHNLANVDTAGFKRHTPLAARGRDFATELADRLPSVRYDERLDWTPGNPRETGSGLDVSLRDGTFLRVQDAAGRVFYTRNGKLQLDHQGRLVTPSGLRFLDQAGKPMQFDDGEATPTEITIAPNGQVGNPKNGQTYGQLGVCTLPDPQRLQPVGGGLYQDLGRQQPVPAQDGLRQGYEEGSNVDSLQEMVQMIIVQRSFSATQRALGSVTRMQDSLIQNLNR